MPDAVQGQTTLQMLMGQQRVAVIGSTHRLTLAWKLARDDETGLALELMAEQGPMGTRDYRIAARIETCMRSFCLTDETPRESPRESRSIENPRVPPAAAANALLVFSAD